MTANVKNITNGEIDLNVDADDRVSDNIKLLRVPGGDIFDTVRRKIPNEEVNYYIQNIRTGSFTQISEAYKMESHRFDESGKKMEDDQDFTTHNTFDTEMYMLRQSLEEKIKKSFTFFQGIFAGMALLFTITLNLSESVSKDLVRVEDQSIRIISLLSSLGAIYSTISARDQYLFVKIRGSSAQVDLKYKCLILSVIEMVLYVSSYIIFNVSHPAAVKFNIQGENYNRLSALTTVYTIIAVLAWIVTNVNTYKHS